VNFAFWLKEIARAAARWASVRNPAASAAAVRAVLRIAESAIILLAGRPFGNVKTANNARKEKRNMVKWTNAKKNKAPRAVERCVPHRAEACEKPVARCLRHRAKAKPRKPKGGKEAAK